MSGWGEFGLRDEGLFNALAKIVVDKAQKEAIFAKGDATAVVNILKSMESLDLENDEFLSVLLEFLVDHFDELKFAWASLLFKTLGTITNGSQELLLRTMTVMCQPLHKKMKAAYDTSQKGAGIMIDDIPDLYDYQ